MMYVCVSGVMYVVFSVCRVTRGAEISRVWRSAGGNRPRNL